MSNIGTVYELNLKTRMKNLYPVVYENGKYYVCKVHGCHDIKTFPKTSFWGDASWSAVTYETFKKFYEDDKYANWHNRVFVFVKNGEQACFEPFMEMTSEERRLEILEKNLNTAKDTLNRAISNLKYNEKCVENAKEKVKTLEKEKANIEKIMQKKKLEKGN
jgi:23S rRNA maturation mini-RNase III